MWSGIEREELATTLRAAEPSAPTLDEGWQARHLAAHLYLRRHRPWAMGSLAEVAARAEGGAGYAALVDAFAAPVPARSPLTLIDRSETANLAEYVIHHEDLRRGSGPAPSRELPAEQAAALLSQLRVFTLRLLRGCPVGVVLETREGPARIVRTGPAPVTVRGPVTDLALALSGRMRAADVQVAGPARAVGEVRRRLT